MMKTVFKIFEFNFKNSYYNSIISKEEEDNVSCPSLFENSIFSQKYSQLRLQGSNIVDSHQYRPDKSLLKMNNCNLKEGWFFIIRTS